jgi:hypothetical protein
VATDGAGLLPFFPDVAWTVGWVPVEIRRPEPDAGLSGFRSDGVARVRQNQLVSCCFALRFRFLFGSLRRVGFDAASASVVASPPVSGVPRLPLSTRSRTADRSSFREADDRDDVAARAGSAAARTDIASVRSGSAAHLDRCLRALSGRAARCRLVEGWLAAGLLSRRSWFPLGFVRLGDYTSERLGIGARILEEEARVAACLPRLPRITAAFLDGSIPWTAVRLVAGVACARNEGRWLEQARSLDTCSLTELVRAGGTGRSADANPEDSNGGAADPAAPSFGNTSPNVAKPGAIGRPARDEDDEDDPKQRWEVRVSHSGRRLWRAACEMAQRTAGTRLTPAQVLEQVAAEAASGGLSEMVRGWNDEPSGEWIDEPSPAALPADGEGSLAAGEASPPATSVRPKSLVELLAAEIERAADAPGTNRLPFLTLESALELEERDPLMAAFYVDLLGGKLDLETTSRGGDDAPAPETGWFEATLRRIGEAEGFGWLTKLHGAKPMNPADRLQAELDAMEAAEPHTIDARLREVRAAVQGLDFEMAGLLREAADRRLYREFGLANLEQYVENRLGLSARTAWSLLAIERATRRCCPLLGEAWRSGRVSTLAARALLPVIGGGHGREWIEHAGIVTLRRLEAEVTWALDRFDERAGELVRSARPAEAAGFAESSGSAESAPSAGSSIDHGIAPPPLDLDLANAALAVVSPDGLRMRAQGDGPDPAAAGDRLGVPIGFFAPESVIFLAEETMHGLRRGFESRGRAFERMVATALLEWTAAPRHRDPVFERDGWRCAVPGCRSRRNLHDHHVVFRSHGGDNARDNRITVCAAHHLHGLHRGSIQARGQAPHAIVWELGIRFGHDGGGPLARLVGDRYLDGSGR